MVRLKNRYIVIEIKVHNKDFKPWQELRINNEALARLIQSKVEQLHGDFGKAAILAGLMTKYVNEHTKIAVIRCRLGPHKLISSTIPFITQIETYNVSINILYIGASIKKSFNFIKLYQEQKCEEFCRVFDVEEARIYFKNSLLDFQRVLKALN